MRFQINFPTQSVILFWALQTTCSYWRTSDRFSLLSVQCSCWLPCWLQFGADRASLEGHYSEFSANTLFSHTITNGTSTFQVVNLVLSAQWCMDVFYCSFDSLTNCNVPLAQMKNQGLKKGKSQDFWGWLPIFSVLPELSAPGTLEVASWKDGFDVRPELQFGLCRLKLPLSLSISPENEDNIYSYPLHMSVIMYPYVNVCVLHKGRCYGNIRNCFLPSPRQK